ncbi:PAS domain-containing sensor histidine kinase [Methylobrevis albus]|uniref:histidine kinase n=1 Tax=Methylobrevis albus TaxID=2793297 RepID=A0A931I1E0_9HYPH|nr:PAS domain-containing sensor histidine kinase [Methylobrevis albus]MBH0237163.1 PAS domain-containing sensor histidine kinase [Methylobrevis albus]
MRIRELKRLFDWSLEGMVHGSAASDALDGSRHRAFIGSHLVGGLCALAALPLAVLATADGAVFASIALAILGLEAVVAVVVSRTGRLGLGYVLSAVCLTGIVGWVAGWTGGLGSFALVWFAFAPVEAALSGDRRVVAASALIGISGVVLVGIAGFAGILPAPLQLPGHAGAMASIVTLAAVLYATLVAIRIDRIHREAETRMRTGERHYRLLADAVKDVVTCHAANGDVAFASPAAGRLTGVMPSALMGDGLFRRVHVADRPAWLTALSAGIHDGYAEVEFRLRRADEGTDAECFVWVEAVIRRIDDADPVAGASAVAVIRDIDRRKHQEEELLRARNEAEEASFAKTRFLANVSHELRTPLNAIIGFSDLLGQEIFGKLEYERHREYVRLIHESGEHLLQVVNDILDMSKIEAGSFDVTPEPFDLGAVIERCRQMLAPQAEAAKVVLRADVEPDLPELVADRRACRQILLNLLSNGIKFTDCGGEIVCGARRNGRTVSIFVKDNGIGIAAADLPRLGNPFVQAQSGYDRRHEGTGLGLSVVKGLAALHGGTMTIDSVLGAGTTVTVTLPLNAEKDVTVRLPSRRGAELPPPAAPVRTARRA